MSWVRTVEQAGHLLPTKQHWPRGVAGALLAEGPRGQASSTNAAGGLEAAFYRSSDVCTFDQLSRKIF